MVRSPGERMMVGKGFTLVEVMVSLAVFAIVSVALVGNSMSTLRQAGIIQDRTLATWLAEDEITKLRMQPRSQENFPRPGTLRQTSEMGRVEWSIETEIEESENEDIQRVTVRVYRANESEPTTELVGFLGRY